MNGNIALTALRERLDAGYSADLLSEEAQRDAQAVLAACDPETDSDAAVSLGWYHWKRSLLQGLLASDDKRLPDSQRLSDLAMAFGYFMLAYPEAADALPRAVSRALRQETQGSADTGGDPIGNTTLALDLMVLFEQSGQRHFLDQAVRLLRGAATTAGDHPGRAAILTSFGEALRILFEQTGDDSVLAEAVRTGREAVAATASGNPTHAAALANLGLALTSLYQRTGEAGALAEAVQAGRDAVAATPADHPARASRLNELGLALQNLFELTGEIRLLTEAIQAFRDVLAANPAGPARRVSALNNLGTALRTLSRRTGRAGTLAEAVQVLEDAVAAAPADFPDRAVILSNHALAVLALSEQTTNAGELTETIQAERDAITSSPADSPERARYLDNFVKAITALSEQTSDAGVLAAFVQAERDAVAAASNNFSRAAHLSELGRALMALSVQTGDIGALAEAIQAGRDAVAMSHENYPAHAVILSRLGSALTAMSERTGEADLLAEARRCLSAAAASTVAEPLTRIEVYRKLAALADDHPGGPEARLHAAEAAVDLVELLAPRSLARADRERQIGRIAGLAGEAASAALSASQPGRAVELLEQARGILIADAIGAPDSDQTRLRRDHPHLADQLDELRAQFDAPDHAEATEATALASPNEGDHSAETLAAGQRTAARRKAAFAAWSELLARIRATPGYQDFLQPPKLIDLARQASDGPIVFISTSASRCDALILTDNPGQPVTAVPLPALTHRTAVGYSSLLMAARDQAHNPEASVFDRAEAQRDILGIMAWLWDSVTGPVLDALGYTSTPETGSPWPRVWWCPTQVAGALPLHAAGHHGDLAASSSAARQANPRTVLDRVVSSYTPTIRSLSYARAKLAAPADEATLIVAVPTAPGAPVLPGASSEANMVAGLIPGAQVLRDPTRDSVLAALPRYPVAHFACHGYADWEDPSRSSLVLRTGPLTVADISALRITSAMAFLSACETGRTAPRFADESTHITGAFHLAGYQHVIGTLWPVSDSAAARLAKDFYAHLTHNGTTPPDASQSARALHDATCRLRARYPANPTQWAAHTHTGI